MDFTDLTTVLFEGLKPTLEGHPGLSVFAGNRVPFEGWLKTELAKILVDRGFEPQPEPEKGRIAIGVGDWALEVRTLITNIHYENVSDVKRSMTKNVETLVKDIWKLTNPGTSTSFPRRAMLVAVYPVTHDNERWQSVYLRRIAEEVTRLEHMDFRFQGGFPGVVYLGLCVDVH